MSIKRAIVRGRSIGVLTCAKLGFFGGFAGVAVCGRMVPKFTKLMTLAPLKAGLLVAIANLTGSLLRIPFGAWADHSGGKKPFATLLSLALIGIIGLIMVLHGSYPNHMVGKFWLVILIGMFIGSGIATFSVGISQGSYWFPESRQGMASGAFAGVGSFASRNFSLRLLVLVVALGLLNAYYLWAAFLAAVLVVYLVGIHDAPFFQLKASGITPQLSNVKIYGKELIPQGSATESLKEAGKSWVAWVFVIFYFISFGGLLGLTSWRPSF